jgi:prepilin-type N-terminal cleavage/methylation domain-containing protein
MHRAKWDNKGRELSRRGFTLIELAVGMTLFLAVAGVLTYAMARTVVSQQSVRATSTVSSALDGLLNVAETRPYEELSTGSFTRPLACTDDNERSCITVSARSYVVTWEVVTSGTGTAAGSSSETDLTVSTTFGDTVITRSRSITAPFSAWEAGAATVNTRITGVGSSSIERLHLVDDQGNVYSATPQASASNSSVTYATFRTPAGACTTALPCRFALDPNGDALAGGMTLDPASASARVVTAAGTVAQANITVAPTSPVTFRVLAGRSITATSAETGFGEPAPRTLCLWLDFTDGGNPQQAAACNGDVAGNAAVRFDRYIPAGGSVAVGIPNDAVVTVRTDSSTGVCPEIGQYTYTAEGTTAAGTVCTSWTWGYPSHLRTVTTTTATTVAYVPANPASVITGGASYYDLIWTQNGGAPAAGADGLAPAFSAPRLIPACAASASCTPVSTETTPESVSCGAGSACLTSTSLRPYLSMNTSGRLATNYAPTNGSTTSLSFTATNPVSANQQMTVRVAALNLGTSDTLRIGAATLTAGSVIGSSYVTGDTITLTFTNSSTQTTAMRRFTLEVSDNVTGATRTMTVGLAPATMPWQVRTIGAAALRGDTNTAAMLVEVVRTDGTSASATTGLSVSAPAGSGLTSATVTTASAAQTLAINYVASTTAVASPYVRVTLNSASSYTTDVPVSIIETAGPVSFAGQSSPQPNFRQVEVNVASTAVVAGTNVALRAGLSGVTLYVTATSNSTTRADGLYLACATTVAGSTRYVNCGDADGAAVVGSNGTLTRDTVTVVVGKAANVAAGTYYLAVTTRLGITTYIPFQVTS